MRKFLSVLFALMMATKAWGYDFEVEGLCYNIIKEETGEVTHSVFNGTYFSVSGAFYYSDSGTNYAPIYDISAYPYPFIADLEIPSAVSYNSKSYKITKIGSRTFVKCSGLKTVSIPNTVTAIDDFAFYGCSNLESVSMPSSSVVTSIRNDVFAKCKKLKTISIPNTVITIGNRAFYICSKLGYVDLPDNLKTIGEHAFYCSGIGGSTGKVYIPASTESIGIGAFANCKNLKEIYVFYGNKNYTSTNGVLYNKDQTKLIQYPAGKHSYSFSVDYPVTEIGDYAFGGSTELYEVEISYPVNSIGKMAFYGCSNMTYVAFWTSEISEIKPSTFSGCSKLNVAIPKSVKTIGNNAFNGCSSFTSVCIPHEATTIGYNAFEGCSTASYVTIPQGVTSVGSNAFKDCSNATIYCQASSIPSTWNSAWNSSNLPVKTGCKVIGVEKTAGSGSVSLSGTNYAVKDDYGYLWYDGNNGIVTIAAKPAEGYHALWEDGMISNSRTFAVSASKTYKVSFVKHTEKEDPAVSATCTAAGKTAGKHCAVCNAVTLAQEVVPAKGHAEVTDVAVPATCTTAGKTAGKHCSVCNAVTQAQEVVPAKGHAEVTDVAVPATCTTAGKTAGKHCSVCNEVIQAQEVVPAKGHAEETDVAVEPTCTAPGLTAGKHCSVCTAVLVTQEVRPAIGHLFTEYVYDDNATTEADGTETAYCDRLCGATHVRQAVGTRLLDNPTAVSGTENNHINIRSIGGSVVVENAQADIFIYDIAGCLVAHQKPQTRNVIAVGNNGMYIVKCGTTTTKVVVM